MKLIRRELWKSVPGFPNYEVSNYGRVRNIVTGKVLKPIKNSNGYYIVTLYLNKQGKNFYIHRLVAEAFIGPEPKNSECNHKLGVKAKCEAWNLEWSTPKENMKHACDIGLIENRIGEDARNVKLTKEEVQKIKVLYATGKYSQNSLGEYFGVSQGCIGKIVLGKTWVKA